MNSVFVLVAALAILAYLVFWRYREIQIDWLRQDLFKQRDILFDLASNGKISFDNPAYGMLRTTINGYIRFAHRISIWQTIYFFVVARPLLLRTSDDFVDRWNKNVGVLSSEMSRELDKLKKAMERRVLLHIILVSPEMLFPILGVFVATVLVVGAYLLSSRATNEVRKRYFSEKIQEGFSCADGAALVSGSV